MDEFHLPQKPFKGWDAVVSNNSGDFNSLSAALRAAQPGWTIWVAPGTYNEDGCPNFAIPNVTIIGSGPETTLCKFGANSFVTTSAATFLKIQGVGFTGTGASFVTLCSFQGANSEAINCHFYNMGTLGATLNAGAADFSLQNCYLKSSSTDVNGQAFAFSGASAKINSNTFIYNSTYTNTVSGNAKFSGQYSQIVGNVFKYNTTGSQRDISVEGSNITFSGNTIYHTGGGDIILLVQNATSTTISNNTIAFGSADVCVSLYTGCTSVTLSGNTISGTGATAMFIGQNATALNCSVIGNTITGATGQGVRSSVSTALNITGNNIKTGSGGVGIVYNNSTFANITGNTIELVSAHTGVQANSAGSTITGNTFKGISTSIAIDIASNYTTIVANNFDTTMTAPLTWPWTRKGIILKDNLGATPIQNRLCLYCKNTSGASIAQGAVVVRKAVAAGNEITTTTTASDNFVLGVADEAIADTAWGYVCVEGKTIYQKVNGTTDIAVGDYLTTFTTAEIAAKAAAGNLAFAIALEAYTTDNSSGVIDALIINPIRL